MVNAPQAPTEQEKIKALPWNLAHSMLNSIFAYWTFGGSVFILFLHELGLPKAQIGTLLALFPFAGLIALGFAPLATRLGWKRVYITGYALRYITMAALLFLPAILARAGYTAGMIFLFAVLATFALMRSLAETAYYPWTQEFIPNRIRGKYTAILSALGTLTTALALIVAGMVIGPGNDLSRFMLLLGAGCAIGLVGITGMLKIPGGAPVRQVNAPGAHYANMARALRDSNFVAYLGGMAGITLGSALLTSFMPLYVKEQIGLPSGTVVFLDTAVMVGGGLSSFAWGWIADRVGSRPVLMPALSLLLAVPVGWLLLPRQAPHAVAWCAALYFALGVISSGAAIGAGRLLFNGVVPQEKSTAYTAIYYAWMGLTGGAAPLLAGEVLSGTSGWRLGTGAYVADGYTILFSLSLALLLFGWLQYRRVRPDDVYTTREAWRNITDKLFTRRKS